MWYFIFIAFLNEAVWRGANLVWPDGADDGDRGLGGFQGVRSDAAYGHFRHSGRFRSFAAIRKPGAPVDHTFDAIAEFFDGTYRHSATGAARPAASLSSSRHEGE